MNLYFQFLTQNQTTQVARMLEVIAILVDGQVLKGHVNMYAQGAISRSTFSELGALAGRIAEKRFNELELVPETSRLCLAGSQADIDCLQSIFSVSPTCALWLPTRDWKTDGDRASDNRYRTAKSNEEAMNFHHVSKKPSVFGLLVSVKTKLSRAALLDECAGRLARKLPDSFDSLHLFGCCDVVEPVVIPHLERSVVIPYPVMMKVKPPAFPELGERFEDLHPLMFGSKRLCKGISDALGGDARLIRATHATDFAVVRLAKTCDRESARTRAADWLINATELT